MLNVFVLTKDQKPLMPCNPARARELTCSKTAKRVHGFATGDLVKAIVTQGKKIGTYCGRVAVRSTGNFNIKFNGKTVQGINFKYCQLIQRSDGFSYVS